MIVPMRAPVRPHIISSETGETLLLEDEIRLLLDSGRRGLVCLTGPPGSGKTTAVQHLKAILPGDALVSFWDDNTSPDVPGGVTDRLGIFTAVSPQGVKRLAAFQISPWREDDAIEYLLESVR